MDTWTKGLGAAIAVGLAVVIAIEKTWRHGEAFARVVGAACLVFGLFTRFWAFSLIIVTIVAIAGVHWPDDWNSLAELWKGYAVTDKGFGNYRIPLLFLAMLFPLLFIGGGKLSLDYLIARKLK